MKTKFILPFLVFVSLLAFCFACVGCAGNPFRKKISTPAEVKVETKTGVKYNQQGDVKTKPEVKADTTTVEIPLPSGSVSTVTLPTRETPGKIEVKVTADSKITSTTENVSVKGATSFSPPTPQSEAEADSFKYFVFAGIGLALLAGLCVYAGHIKAAGIAGVGALAVPLLGKFFMSEIAFLVFFVVIAIAGTLIAAWYIIKRKPELVDKISKEIHDGETLAVTTAESVKAKIKAALEKL